VSEKPSGSGAIPAPQILDLDKVYLRAIGINKFELVDKPGKATVGEKEAMEVTLKQFKGAELEQAPRKVQQIDPGWIISMEKTP